jgi:hypothetical protein
MPFDESPVEILDLDNSDSDVEITEDIQKPPAIANKRPSTQNIVDDDDTNLRKSIRLTEKAKEKVAAKSSNNENTNNDDDNIVDSYLADFCNEID